MGDADFARHVALSCLARSDQNWRALEERIPEVLRIAMHGPTDSDEEFVRRVFGLLSYELTQRREGRS